MLENVALLLEAAIQAQGRVGVMLNVRRRDLDRVLGLLPALQRPTELQYRDATNSYSGYTLFAAQGNTYLIDMSGLLVRFWPLAGRQLCGEGPAAPTSS